MSYEIYTMASFQTQENYGNNSQMMSKDTLQTWDAWRLQRLLLPYLSLSIRPESVAIFFAGSDQA